MQTSFPVKPPENGGEPKYYTVRFLNGDTVLQEGYVDAGEMPVFNGEVVPPTDYMFVGWLPALAPVTANVDYVAQFKYTKSITRAIVNRSITSYSNDTITSAGTLAFRGCNKLSSVSIPSATTIGTQSFESCSSLTSVSIPSVTTIGSQGFMTCRKLTSVTLPAIPPTIQSNSFYNINANCVFYVPTGSLSAYQSATNWSTLTNTYTFTEV